MKTIYLIVSKRTETYGHGSYGESYRVGMVGSYDEPPPMPAFESSELAEKYIISKGLRGLSVIEISLISSETCSILDELLKCDAEYFRKAGL